MTALKDCLGPKVLNGLATTMGILRALCIDVAR